MTELEKHQRGSVQILQILQLCFCECSEDTQTEDMCLVTENHEGKFEKTNQNMIFNGLPYCQDLSKDICSVHRQKKDFFLKFLEINSKIIVLKFLDLDHLYSLIISTLWSK